MTVLEDFARRLTREAGTPAAERDRLALHLLDTIGAWVGGHATGEGRALATLRPDLLGDGRLDRLAGRVAATRLTEVDDIHMRSCVTPGAVAVWAALAFAGGEPDRLARALSAAYTALARLGEAAGGPAILYRGIWPTYLAAPFGAAAAAAVGLGLDAAATADALAIALTLSATGAGNQSQRSSRWLLLGLAARAGAGAALAAARGFGGDRALLDGDWFQRAHGIALDAAPFTTETDAVAELSIKPWCSAKQAIAAIDGFRALLARGIAADAIEEVTVAVPPAYARMIEGAPTGGRLARITSVAYQFALAARRPEMVLELERPDLTGDPAIAALLGRVRVVPDEALATYYPARWPARVEIITRDGARHERLVADALGDPANPFDQASAMAKFHRLADVPLGGERAARLAGLSLRATRDAPALTALRSELDAIDAAAQVA